MLSAFAFVLASLTLHTLVILAAAAQTLQYDSLTHTPAQLQMLSIDFIH